MALQGAQLTMTNLGLAVPDQIEAGVHLRWAMAAGLGFPSGGFDLYRRPHLAPSPSCVKVSIDRRGSELAITVDDEGPGIDEDKLATIFDRFYTYRPTAYASRGDNSGLGLSISREIVVAHGGQIWAENRIEGSGAERRRTGSRFVVRLPASARGGSTGGRRG